MESNLSNEILLERSEILAQKLWKNDPQFASYSMVSTEQINTLLSANTCIEILKNLCEAFASRPAIGFRIFENFETISYAELWKQVERVASGLKSSGIVKAGDFVGICAFGSLDFILIDFACLYLGAVSVPLQTNMSPNDLSQVILNAGLTSIVISQTQLANVSETLLLNETTTVKNLGLIDLYHHSFQDVISAHQNSYDQLLQKHSLRFWSLEQMKTNGETTAAVPMHMPQPDDLATLVYTSGSTGLPKGAMMSHAVWQQSWKKSGFSPFPESPFIVLNFMPLNHIMGRYIIIGSLQKGGTVYFTKDETMSTLFEDMKLVRPTVLYFVPRISEMIFQQYQLKLLQNESPETVMDEMGRTFLGDRLLFCVTAAAPTSEELFCFLRNCFKIPIFDAYGATETGILTFNNKIIADVVEDYRLVDVPELGYSTKDKPYPRGEFHVKSSKNIPGYYKNPDISKNLFDENGFIKTGDIVEERAKGEIICIDRIKNIQKLSNGEFVALARLENIFESNSSFIQQMYLYGQSARSYLLGVVVPNFDAIKIYLSKQKTQDENSDIKTIAKALIKDEISQIMQKEKLFSYEAPRDFIVETEPFTKKNRLITESNKYARARLKETYFELFEAMYKAIDEGQFKDLSNLKNLNENSTAVEKLKSSLCTVLNLNPNDFETQSKKFSFKELGGDSLNAVAWSGLVEQLCGFKISVSLILNPAMTLQKLINSIETQFISNQTSVRYSFASIHGKNPATLFTRDLDISKFFTENEIRAGLSLKSESKPKPIKNIFLTGANGFLGKFLTFELLSQVVRKNGKIYCVVRAENDEKAYERVVGAFEQSSPELKAQFHMLPSKHLIVFAGDLTSPQFGLNDEIYNALSEDVDAIVHNGALVNHAFSYEELFDANVLGTVEIIRLAITKSLKSITFISSIAVTAGLNRKELIDEHEDVRTMWPERSNSNGYAEGYGASKWAGEVLLRNAHDLFALPINVFRSGMILAHPEYQTELNTADYFTRLISGVVNTGLVPESFYAKTPESNIKPYFDGLPVNFIASTIAASVFENSKSYANYHVVNQQGNADVSFDTIFDWIRAAGYTLKKIPSYNQWFEEFEASLKALTTTQKKYSPLQILHQWQHPIVIENETRLDNAQFKALALKLDPTLTQLPCLSENYILKYINDMSALGIVD